MVESLMVSKAQRDEAENWKRRLVVRLNIALVVPTSMVGLGFLKLSNDASLATFDTGQEVSLGTLAFFCGVATLIILVISGVQGTILKSLNVLALVVVAFLMANTFIPSLNERIADNKGELMAFVERLRRDQNQTWPVQVGPFSFLGAKVEEDRVTLLTKNGLNPGQHGLQWGKPAIYGDLSGLSTVTLASGWSVVNRR